VNRRPDKGGSLLQSRLFRGGDAGGALANMDTVSILAVNQDTLDEYEITQQVNADYTQKLVRWINKKKYWCAETEGAGAPEGEEALEMRVDEVFNFRLKKKAKTELDKVKEQMK
jgi:hypothetical protein